MISFISESAKGSDSEDDFLRQKSKPKAASDSDSDSDGGSQKRTKCFSPIRSDILLLLFMSKWIFPPPVYVAMKAAADDLFGEADDISSDSDAEKPPTPGQPLVSISTLDCKTFLFSELDSYHLFYAWYLCEGRRGRDGGRASRGGTCP